MKKIIMFTLAAVITLFSLSLSYSAGPSDWDWGDGGHSKPSNPYESEISPSYPGDTRTDEPSLADKVPGSSSSGSSGTTPSTPAPTVPSVADGTIEDGIPKLPSWAEKVEPSVGSRDSISGVDSGFTYGNVTEAANNRLEPAKNVFFMVCKALFPLSILVIIGLCMFCRNEKKFALYIAMAGSVTLATFIVLLLQNGTIDHVIKLILKSLGMS